MIGGVVPEHQGVSVVQMAERVVSHDRQTRWVRPVLVETCPAQAVLDTGN